MIRTSALLLASAALPLPVLAQDAPQDEPAGEERAEPSNDDFHGPIYVTAAGVDRLDIIAGTSVISGIQLQRESAGQIGEILVNIPGVSASSPSTTAVSTPTTVSGTALSPRPARSVARFA